MAKRDPLLLIYEALKAAARAAIGPDITVKADYPSPAYFKARVPAVGLLKISGTSTDRVTPGDAHVDLPPNQDNSITVVSEYRRYSYLVQLSVFAKSKRERSDLGQSMEEYLQKNRYLSLPGDVFGDFTLITVQGVPHDSQGETGFYQRDYTLKCSGRLLIAEDFSVVEDIVIKNEIR